MVAFDGLDIFPNNTRAVIEELLRSVSVHPATINCEPQVVLTKDGSQEFLIPFKFDVGYDINYADKFGKIRLETPIMDKVLRPCVDEKVEKLKKDNSKYGIEHNILRSLHHKNINVYAEYFPKTSSMEEKITVYAISETDDVPWGNRIQLNTSKKSTESLFRHFTSVIKKPVDEVRNLIIVQAKIQNKPLYNWGTTPSGFQIDFVYKNIFHNNDNTKEEYWKGYSTINHLHMGRFMKLFDASDTRKLAGKDISVYIVHNPGGGNIICGIGSYNQYLTKVKF
jgi:hypothetical protein